MANMTPDTESKVVWWLLFSLGTVIGAVIMAFLIGAEGAFRFAVGTLMGSGVTLWRYPWQT